MKGPWWLLVNAGLFYLMMCYGCGAHMVHGGHYQPGSTTLFSGKEI